MGRSDACSPTTSNKTRSLIEDEAGVESSETVMSVLESLWQGAGTDCEARSLADPVSCLRTIEAATKL